MIDKTEDSARPQGHCPFCGSEGVYYNEHYRVWRCGRCEKSFPSPSYGSGQTPPVRRGQGGLPGWAKPVLIVLISAFALILVYGLAGQAIVAEFNKLKEQAVSGLKSFETGIQPVGPPSFVPTPTPPAPIPTPAPQPMALPEISELVQYELDLINKDRAAAGLDPVVPGTNTAAQQHADEMLAHGYTSHWDLNGLKPYMRYTLAGGFNYEMENVFSTVTVYTGPPNLSYQRDPKQMLDGAETGLMNSPGHRKNILYPWHKKVNIGIAYDRDSLYLDQQFEGDYVRFNSPPALSNGLLALSGQTSGGFTAETLQIWYDQPPHSLTLGQLGATYSYTSGTPLVFVRPPPPHGSYYPTSQTTYSWAAAPVDPYSLPPGTSLPTPGVSRPPSPTEQSITATISWLNANYWQTSGSLFDIRVDLGQTIAQNGPGVYTVVIGARNGSDIEGLTNYSILVK